MNIKDTSILCVAAAASVWSISCGGSGTGFDCTTQESSYESTAASEGKLAAAIPEAGPFPMAMVLSQGGVNSLLTAVLDQDFNPVTVAVLGADVVFQPSLPTIALESFDDCPTCVVSSLALNVESVAGFSLGFDMNPSFSVPINMKPKETGATGVMVGLNNATVLNLGVDSGDLSSVDSALGLLGLSANELLADGATKLLRSQFGETELFELDAWKVSEDVELAARGPMIFPDQGTIVLGLHTNLDLPTTATLQEQASLPQDSDMGLQFHPDLLLGMVQRLMNEGEIGRNYDASGNFTSGGDHQVTMNSMSTMEGDDALITEFRIWRTSGGLCGFADFQSALAAQIDGEAVKFTARDFQFNGGEGIGNFLNESQWLAGDFVDSMAQNIELTVNYEEMGFSGEEKSITPKANSLTINGQGMSVFLNLGIDDNSGE